MLLSERQRGAAAHRAAGHDRALPADVVHQLGEIVGELLDAVRSFRLVGGAVAAAVIGEDDRSAGEQGDRPVPEEPVHAERMDQHEPRTPIVAAMHVVDKPRAVTQLYSGSHDMLEAAPSFRPSYRAAPRKPQAETSRCRMALRRAQTSRCMTRSAMVAALSLPIPPRAGGAPRSE